MKYDESRRGYFGSEGVSHDRKQGLIDYNRLRYNRYKSVRNRMFMNSFENEFN